MNKLLSADPARLGRPDVPPSSDAVDEGRVAGTPEVIGSGERIFEPKRLARFQIVSAVLFSSLLEPEIYLAKWYSKAISADSQIREAILAAAPPANVDLSDQANAFTVWSTEAVPPIFCGGCQNPNDARALAREFLNLKKLVILSANPKYGLTWVPDEDRVTPPPRMYPGSRS
jgi:hypothetical protein